MGGKQKQAQRSKGNVRPSSSARAAELLASGGAGSGFIGFGALSGDLGYVPVSGSGTEDSDSGVDADFRMVLRRMAKRDATTRLKALQEMMTLCQEKDVEAVETILPFWPRIYCKLAIDVDRRVREASQQALGRVVSRVRRSLAPHLRAFMGSWLVSQCDQYAPAASAAGAAFQAAFPPTKQVDALLHCKQEIMTHIQENLLSHTPATLSDPKSTAVEEMETKYQRVLAGSLLAWRQFMMAVPAPQEEKLQETYAEILKQGKFWKLAKHSSSQIRAAFYALLAAMCQANPSVAEQFADKICPQVLHYLGESDPLVCPALWEAALHVVSGMPDCWSKVNPRKGMLPSLWSLLKAGGGGSATKVFPNLLPFLSKLPPDVIGEEIGFYQEFFNNLKTGLTVDRVMSSTSETSAIIQALIECLRYVLRLHFTDSPEDLAMQDLLVNDVLLALIESSIVEPSSPLQGSSLYPLTVDLLLWLYKSAQNPEDQNAAQAGVVQANMWDTLRGIILTQLEVGETSAMERITRFLLAFHGPLAAGKKKVKISFSLEEGASKPRQQSKPATSEVSPLVQDAESPLGHLVAASCSQVQEQCSDLATRPLKFFAQMLKIYKTTHLLEHLLGEKNLNAENVTIAYFDKVLMPWLLRCPMDRAVAGSLVDVMETVYRMSDAEETRLHLLVGFYKGVNHATLLELFSGRLLKGPTDALVTKWFQSSEFGELVVANTQALCDDTLKGDEEAIQGMTSDGRWALLKVALSTNRDQEPLLCTSCLDEMLLTIVRALPAGSISATGDLQQVNRCVMFVCEVASLLFTNVQGSMGLSSAEDLLVSLFQLSCHTRSPLTDEVLHKVELCWQGGFAALLHRKGGLLSEGGFLLRATELLKSIVQEQVDSLNSLELLNGIGAQLLRGYHTHTADVSSLDQFAQHLYTKKFHVADSSWWLGPLVTGQLSFSHLPAEGSAFDMGIFPKCLASLSFASQMMRTVATEIGEEGSEETCGVGVDVDVVLLIAQGSALCQAVIEGRQEVLTGTELGGVSRMLDGNLTSLLESLTAEQAKNLCQEALTKSYADGGLWALTLRLLRERLKKKLAQLEENWSFVLDRLSDLTLSTVQTTQALLPFLPTADSCTMLEMLTAQLLSLPADMPRNYIQGGLGLVSLLSRTLAVQDDPLAAEDLPGVMGRWEIPVSVANELKMWRETEQGLFLLDTSLSGQSWPNMALNVDVMRFLGHLVAKFPTKVPHDLWDFLLCSTIGWVQSLCADPGSLLTSPSHQAFATAACHLLADVAHCLSTVQPGQPAAFPPDLSSEWMEFFSQTAYSVLLPAFVDCTGHIDLSRPSICQHALLTSMAAALVYCPSRHLLQHKLLPRLIAHQVTNLPDDLQTTLNHLCPLLLAPHRSTQLAAYRMLHSVMSSLPAYDEGKESAEELQKEEITRSPPESLLTVLETSGSVVAGHLDGLRVGENAVLEPATEEYTAAMAYLLGWRLLLAFFTAAPSQLKAEYAVYLRDQQLLAHLMIQLFRLLPETPVVQLQDVLTSQPPTPKLSPSKTLFSEQPLFNISGSSSSLELQHLACSTYYDVLKELPAAIRDWWNVQDKRTAGVVDKFTSKYVSPILCATELSDLQNTSVDSENMTVKVRMGAREVLATYTVQEFSMELLITLPSNHPLGPIGVESSNHMGVTQTQWRNWLLQMTIFLSHQNGSLQDGVLLWKRNVDKRFEGVDDCMVCFSVIHNSNYQLPRLTCRVCKKKFHSACLYKWFNTSNQSSCPMCRSLF